MKPKQLYRIDIALIPTAIATAISGFTLHLAGHGTSHETWHNIALLHTLSGLAMLALGALHIHAHWGWYKGLLRGKTQGKSLLTTSLSCIFIAAAITGIVALPLHFAPNTGLGLWHYAIGILLIIISTVHIVLRMRLLSRLKKATR